ncbi:transferase [Empedobacter falsenii]
MTQFVLYGFGGHGRVIKDAIEKLGGEVVHIFDQNNPYDGSLYSECEIIIAIGNNEIRSSISKSVKHKLGIIIHPDASVASNVIINEGTVVLANAVIQSGSIVGKNCIVNANVTVDHDVIIEDNVSIYPGSYIGGEAKITQGKTIDPNTTIVRNSVI